MAVEFTIEYIRHGDEHRKSETASRANAVKGEDGEVFYAGSAGFELLEEKNIFYAFAIAFCKKNKIYINNPLPWEGWRAAPGWGRKKYNL